MPILGNSKTQEVITLEDGQMLTTAGNGNGWNQLSKEEYYEMSDKLKEYLNER